MRALILGGLCLLGSAATAGAYDLTRTCLDNARNQGQGLKLVVGPDGDLHLLRIQPLTGDLFYTRVGPDNVGATTLVAPRISRLAIDDVRGPDLRMLGGTLYACFYDAGLGRIDVAVADGAGGFTRETVFEGPGGRDDCALFAAGGRVAVAYNTEAGLSVAVREGVDRWRSEVVDAGRRAYGVTAATLANGESVLAHREEPAWDLRLSQRGLDGRWRTRLVPSIGVQWGMSPAIVPQAGGDFLVFHGFRPGDSDNGLIRTHSVAGALNSDVYSHDPVGGSVAAGAFEEGVAALTRELRRSALFGSAEALYLYTDADRTTLASHSAADQRHRYLFLNAQPDPFRLPVLAVYEDRSPYQGRIDGGYVCWWRPTDTDGDRLPDVVERALGTDELVADTDGDGVSDGIEYLIDRTDPLGGGVLPPLDAGPELDVGLPDLGPPDDDFGFDDAQVRDAAVVDLAVDGGRPPVDADPNTDADPSADADPLADADPSADAGPANDGALSEDAGTADAGPEDLGADSGDFDGGRPDARPRTDAGRRDADNGGWPEADARVPPTGARDASNEAAADDAGGCQAAVSAVPAGPTLWLGALLLGLRRRRR